MMNGKTIKTLGAQRALRNIKYLTLTGLLIISPWVVPTPAAAIETGWSGTIHYKRVFEMEEEQKPFPNALWAEATATGKIHLREEITADITVEAGKPSVAKIKAQMLSLKTESGRGKVNCARSLAGSRDYRQVGSEWSEKITGNLDETNTANVSVSVNKKGEFHIRLGFGTNPVGTADYLKRMEYSGGCKPVEPKEQSFSINTWKPFFTSGANQEVNGTVDPKSITTLSGSQKDGNMEMSWDLTFQEEPITVTARVVSPQKFDEFYQSGEPIEITAEADSTGGSFEEFEIESEKDAYPEVLENTGGKEPKLKVQGSGMSTGKTKIRAVYSKRGVTYRSEPLQLDFCDLRYIVLAQDARLLTNSWRDYRTITPNLATAGESQWFIHGNNLMEVFVNGERKVNLKSGGVESDYIIQRWARSVKAGAKAEVSGDFCDIATGWCNDNVDNAVSYWVDPPGLQRTYIGKLPPSKWPKQTDYYEFISGVKDHPACGYRYYRMVIDTAPDKYRVRMYEAEKIKTDDLANKMNAMPNQSDQGRVINDSGTRNSKGQ